MHNNKCVKQNCLLHLIHNWSGLNVLEIQFISLVSLETRFYFSHHRQKMQLSVIVVLSCTLILVLIKFSETYKPIKPYKFYNPYPWRSRSRWHPFRKSKHYRPKRILPYKYDIYEPDYGRYAPLYEDMVDNTENDKPYVIIIQLPRKKQRNRYRLYQRQHVVDAPQNIDYIDDNDDESKVYHVSNKTVRIKVNDRLSVLTS